MKAPRRGVLGSANISANTPHSTQYEDFFSQVLNLARLYWFDIYDLLGYTPRNKHHFSPLRDDGKTPSLHINPKTGGFVDYGGNHKGDVINFIKALHNTDFKGACAIIADIYNIPVPQGIDFKHIKPLPSKSKNSTKKSKRSSSKEYEIISIKFRDYLNKEEKLYWKRKANAKLEVVLKYTKPIESFVLKRSDGKIIKRSNLSCVFSIEIIPGKKYKIYQPKKKSWGGKVSSVGLPLDKFRETGELPKDYRYSLGLDNADPNKPLYACAGEADWVALISEGINAITLGSEQSSIPEYIANKLKEKGIDLKDLIVVYDVDKTGIKNSLELQKKYGCQRVELPGLDGSKSQNDICDYIGLYGFDERLKLALEPQNRTVDKFLSEDSEYLINKIESKKPGEIIGIDGPPGMGKNTFTYGPLLKQQKKRGGKLFVVYPTNLSARSQTREGIFLLDQYTSKEEREHLPDVVENYSCINVTYNSFHLIAPFITKKDVIVGDEPHKWITGAGICPTDNIILMRNCPARKLLLSGTWFDSLVSALNIDLIHYTRKQSPVNNFKVIEVTDGEKVRFNPKGATKLYKKIVRNIIPCIPEKEPRIHTIFLNNKEEIDNIFDSIDKSKFDVYKLYSDPEIKNNSPIWKCLTYIPDGKDKVKDEKEKLIPIKDKPVIILSTCIAYESVSIENPQHELGPFHIIGETFTENVRQAVGRPRKIKSQTIYYYLAADQKKKPYQYSFQHHEEKWKNDFEKISAEFEKYDKMQFAHPSTNQKIKSKLKLELDLTKVVDGDGKFNVIECVQTYECNKARLETNEQKFEKLESLDNCFIERFTCDVSNIHRLFKLEEEKQKEAIVSAQINAIEVEGLEELEKEKELMRIQQVREIYEENPTYLKAFLLTRRIDPDLKLNIKNDIGSFDTMGKDFLAWRNDLANKCDRKTIDHINQFVKKEIELKQHFKNDSKASSTNGISSVIADNKRYNKLSFALDIHLVLNGDKDSQKALFMRGIYLAVREQFYIGEKYTSTEIKKKCENIYKEYKHTNYKKSDFVKLFDALFDFEKKNTKHARYKIITGNKTINSLAREYDLKPNNNFNTKKKVTKTECNKNDKTLYKKCHPILSSGVQNPYYKTGLGMPF